MTIRVFSLSRLHGISCFTGFGFLATFLELAPIGIGADALPSPDLLFCLAACCALRRPKAVPMPLVFLLGLGRDLLMGAPVGIGALTLVLTTVFLSESRSWFQKRTFWSEWLCCVLIFAATLVVQWFLLAILFVRPPTVLDLVQLLTMTATAYIPIAILLRILFRTNHARDDHKSGFAS